MPEATARPLDAVRSRRGGRSTRVRQAVLAAARAQLMDDGYERLSHLTVARVAGVNPATVHRRWPTRARLAVDALVELAADLVPIPDTGSVRGDLTTFHHAIVRVLDDPQLIRLFQAFSAATFEQDPDVAQALGEFWRRRFDGAVAMLDRACQRGEIPQQSDPRAIIELLVAPAYYRALVTRAPLDEGLTQRSVEHALAMAAVAPA